MRHSRGRRLLEQRGVRRQNHLVQSSDNTTARETVLGFIEPDPIEPPTRRVSRRLRVVALVDERQHTERRFICRRPHHADHVVRRCPGVYRAPSGRVRAQVLGRPAADDGPVLLGLPTINHD